MILRSFRFCACALLAFSLVSSPARAAWDPDGNRVSFHASEVGEYTAIPFGDGAVLLVWSDYELGDYSGSGDVHAQALDADGKRMPGWPAAGLAITSAAGRQQYTALAPDGAGGAYVTWVDFASGGYSLLIQRITRTGTVATGWPPAGRTLAGAVEPAQTSLAPDGAGGVYAGWSDAATLSQNPTLRLLRLGPDGEAPAGWPPGGLVLAVSPWPRRLVLAEDGAGGVYTAWAEPPVSGAPEGSILIRRFTAGGTPHSAWPAAGVAVGERGPEWPRLVVDGAGGVYAAWSPGVICLEAPLCFNCCPSPLSATHLGANGALVPGWPAAGIPFGENGVVASDAAGGLLVGTTSYDWAGGLTATRGHAARMRPDGTPAPGWSLTGNPICSERRQQNTPALQADGTGGTFASWIDYRTFEPVLYVSLLGSSGSVAGGWPQTGSIGSAAAVSPGPPVLVSGRTGEAIVLWSDRRSGVLQLYAERARPGPAGPPAPRVGLGFTVTDIRPNPARGAFWATVSLPEPGIATLELFDIAGRVLESREIAGGRPGVVHMNESGKLAAGVYWLRLRQGSLPSGMRTSIARVALVR